MAFHGFDLERGQSIWENRVSINLSESGVHPASLDDLRAMGLELSALNALPLVYIQTNGTVHLREAIARLYPGAAADQIEVTNGTSEANYIVMQTLLADGGGLLFQTPNYLQVSGIAENLGGAVHTFSLQHAENWAPDWEAFEAGLKQKPRAIYVSNPNNPTGYVLSEDEMNRIVRGAESVGAYVIADEVYQGAEWSGDPSPTFWGRGERVIVTSGLSKAYGLPGLRIGWVVGPKDIVDQCWAWHDYTSISPGTLSDRVARFAVHPETRMKLFARGRQYMGANKDLFEAWLLPFEDLIEYHAPRAGAYAFVKYNAEIASLALSELLRERHGVFIVPGSWMGAEHFLRVGLGGERESFQRALELIAPAFRALQAARV
jgi:hypothetical protein